MLDDRKARILRAVVEEYIQTATPVGSGHVARAPEVDVSPATVRNDMAALEQEGYLRQPHTSAGRVPTDKGYRFFVDQLAPTGSLDAVQRQQVSSFFARAHGALEDTLHDTSRLLAELTDYAAVVVGPDHEDATIRSVQLVGLGPRVALLVAVLSNGVIEKRQVDLPADTGDERLGAATAHLGAHLLGRTMAAVVGPATGSVDALAGAAPVPDTGDEATDAVVGLALGALGAGATHEAEQVYVGGTSRVVASFDAIDTVRHILAILEQQIVVVGVLRDVLDRGLSVAIGAEHGLAPLAECSIVVAPYEVEGERVGTIGVLGPTRMNYPQALAAVAVVGQRLGHRLSEG